MRETTAAKDRILQRYDLSTAANKTKNDPRQGRAMNNRNYAAQLAAGGGLFASQRTRLVQRSITTLGDANREFMDSGRDGGMTINILKNDHLSSLSSCSSSFIINHHE